MEKKYIDAEQLINTVSTLAYPVRHDYGFTSVEAGMTVVGIKQVVDEMSAADVQEVRHGHWISLEEEIGLHECSICGHKILRAECNYCPNCGAKMDEVTKK